ncbi:MAG: hypothetical protein ABUL52_00235 [Solimonas sp.]
MVLEGLIYGKIIMRITVLLALLCLINECFAENPSLVSADSSSAAVASQLDTLSELVNPGRVLEPKLSSLHAWSLVKGIDIAVLSYLKNGNKVDSANDIYESVVVLYQHDTRRVIRHFFMDNLDYGGQPRLGDHLQIIELSYKLGANIVAFGIQIERDVDTARDTRLNLYAAERGKLDRLTLVLDAFKTEEEVSRENPTVDSPNIHVIRNITVQPSDELEYFPIIVQETWTKTFPGPSCAGNCNQQGQTTYRFLHAGLEYLPEESGLYNELIRYGMADRSQRKGAETPWKLVPNTRLRYKLVSGEDCGSGKFCGEIGGGAFEDAATGQPFNPRSVFTRQGERNLLLRFREEILNDAREIIEKLKNGEMTVDGRAKKVDPYLLTQCRKNWNTLPVSFDAIDVGISSTGEMVLSGNGCGWHIVGYDMLDNMSQTFSADELRPYLNTYGKSVLLKEGNVLQPEVEPNQCASSSQSTTKTFPHGGIAEVKGDTGILAVLYNDGQLWVAHSSYIDRVLKPVRVKGEFIHVETRINYVIALARDGSLWEWDTSSYSSMKDYERQTQATKLGDGFLDVRTGWGMIVLKKDGTVWFWRDDIVDPNRTEKMVDMHGAVKIAENAIAINTTPRGNILIINSDNKLYIYDPNQLGTFPARALKKDRLPGQLVGDGYTGFQSGFLKTINRGLVRVAEGLPVDNPTDAADPVVQVTDGANIAVLERNSTLLVSSQGGGATLFPIGCGYADVKFPESYEFQFPKPVTAPYLLALRRDGEMMLWSSQIKSHRPNARPNYVDTPPISLGHGFMTLPVWVDGLDIGSNVFSGSVVFKQDNSVWVHYQYQNENGESLSIENTFSKLLDHFADN